MSVFTVWPCPRSAVISSMRRVMSAAEVSAARAIRAAGRLVAASARNSRRSIRSVPLGGPLVTYKRRDVGDYRRIDVALLQIIGRSRFALAGDEKVVQSRVFLKLDILPAGQPGLPKFKVFRRDLEIAAALHDQHWNGQLLRLRRRVVAFQIQNVNAGQA